MLAPLEAVVGPLSREPMVRNEAESGEKIKGQADDVRRGLFSSPPWWFVFVPLSACPPRPRPPPPNQQKLSNDQQVPPPAPLVLVVSGPSGVGKDAAIRALHAARPGLRFVVTATSRERRPGEVDGVDYSFVSKAEFEGMVSRGELLEHAVVYGEYKGIPRKAVEAALEAARRDAEREVAILRGGAEGEAAAAPSPASPSSSSPPPAPPSGAGVVVLRLDVQGAATVRALLPARSLASVFLAAESEAALAARLAARGTEGAGALATRVATARHEAARAAEFDFVVVNAEGDVEGTVGALGAIVDAERCRSSRRLPPTPPPRPPASS